LGTDSAKDHAVVNKNRFFKSRRSQRILVTLVLVIAVSGFFVLSYAFNFFTPPVNCLARPTGGPGTAVFTIVMADEGMNIGFNGSYYHSAPWPVMNVTLGENVIIHVFNNDTVEAHGFQISHYFDQGLGQSGLAPGKCYDVRFVATTLGSFQVFCNIFCTIHLSMQYGRLNVN
jgi:FtsP/CotA-like multicopper oxidase with cupredoxin domain